MPFPRFPRIERLLGARLEDAQEADLQALAAGGEREGTDLDVKSAHYDGGPQAKEELCKDVAGLANAQGGALILGMTETNGVIDGLAPVELGESRTSRMRMIIASGVAPVPEYDILEIESATDPGMGFTIVGVPRSPWAPHAVIRPGEHRLGYPRRDGNRTRWLEESEIADAYRNRFAAASLQVDRLEQVMAEGRRRLQTGGVRVWLAMALVPNTPGVMTVDGHTRSAVSDWANGHFRSESGGIGVFTPMVGIYPGVGFRRVTFGTNYHEAGFASEYAEFHTDGSGFAAILQYPQQSGGRLVLDETLATGLIGLLALLAEHATLNAGAFGDAAVEVSLLPEPFRTPTGEPQAEITLVHGRRHGALERFEGTELLVDVPQMRHTVNLDEVLASGTGLTSAAGMFLTDLMQAFGHPDALQIAPNGALRRRYFSQPEISAIEGWATSHDVPLLDSTLESERS